MYVCLITGFSSNIKYVCDYLNEKDIVELFANMFSVFM